MQKYHDEPKQYKGYLKSALGSQIVLALQTLVSRELSPRESGVVTVGSFHSGTKHNIISDQAHLQLTVRSTSEQTRQLLLGGIERIAENMGRVAGLAEDMLPEVVISEESTPPTTNDSPLARQLRSAWVERMGAENVVDQPTSGIGAEDFPFFSTDPDVTSVYWAVGGRPYMSRHSFRRPGRFLGERGNRS